MRLIDADVLKQHIDKLPALPDGNFAGNHSALKALINMQPTIEPSTNCSEIQNSSDCISRQQAIEVIEAVFPVDPMKSEYAQGIACGAALAKTYVEQLPSAQPERKKGRWIWWYEEEFTEHATEYTPHCKCSECGRECAPRVATYSNFCRNCGADMRGESDEML